MQIRYLFSLTVLLLMLAFVSAKEATHPMAARQSILDVTTEDAEIDRIPFAVENWPAVTGTFKGGVIWWESFETPRRWAKWNTMDLTLPRPEPIPGQWVLDTWNAYEGQSWRCADLSFGNNGGYGNHWYQVLDTPPLMLDESASLTFYHRYAVEDPAGSSAPYDAWDGLNVRVSTDGGNSWTVLEFNSYTVSSIWAFGEPQQGHNEGPGIAGWAGAQLEWKMESFDLAAYSGSEVMLRFALASDQAFSTVDGDPDLFGWQIDNIEVKSANKTYLLNTGTDEDLVGKSNEYIPPAGGDLWHVVKFQEPLPAYFPDFVPGGNFGAAVQNGGILFDSEATYNPYMDNILYTGPISLPDVAPIYLDFKYLPNFFDADPFPDVEFFRPEVRHADSSYWEPIEAQPYVYSLGFDRWIEFAWTYGYPMNSSMFDLSRFAGQDIYLSFRFWSDYDQPAGYGLLIDDIVIYNPTRELPPPQNVQAEPDLDEGAIIVSWDAMHEEVTYTIGRMGPGESNFFAIGEVKGETQFYDYYVEPYLEYKYVVLNQLKYIGGSGLSNMATATIIPKGVVELGYDDSEPDGFIESAANLKVAVKFTPDSYPVQFSVMKVYLNTSQTTGTAGRFSLLGTDVNGMPGAELQFRLKSGLTEGFNIIEFSTPLTINEGSFYVSFQRFGTSPYVAYDSDPVIDGNTYLQTDDGWLNVKDYDAMFHVFLDTTISENVDFVSDLTDASNRIPEQFELYANYPNPFNPSTTIRFNVPEKMTLSSVSLAIYDVLGQKITTLVNGNAQAGINSVKWDGRNQDGELVHSGIYLYHLKAGNQTLTKRMLLIK